MNFSEIGDGNRYLHELRATGAPIELSCGASAAAKMDSNPGDPLLHEFVFDISEHLCRWLPLLSPLWCYLDPRRIVKGRHKSAHLSKVQIVAQMGGR